MQLANTPAASVVGLIVPLLLRRRFYRSGRLRITYYTARFGLAANSLPETPGRLVTSHATDVSENRANRGMTRIEAPPAGDAELRQLLELARAGDQAAADRLLGRLYPQVRRWALSRTGSVSAADDVAQETLIRVHRGLGTFGGRSRLSTWVYRVMRNVAADRNRRRRRREAALRRGAGPQRVDPVVEADATDAGAVADTGRPPPDTAAVMAETLDRHRLTDLVRTFFRQLPGRQRQVFDLVDLQGHSPLEVAKMLNVKPVSVRAALFRARSTIRRRILDTHPGLVEDRS
jgi:RNA polymerase sigma-70 factor, ECF subfamily